ncbi:MAG TPA: AAA family ATPase [Spirochaetota bacterium]|nr:AAA family ATPase [Spirochaetota bacterium]HOD15297.1 AAA family ATPase [Spirochaetota bacterium]HPG51793.1 AAA family ATPase [Spirochaetota bacterium]HPN13632.1 AAA family ATPase [Spirochaetota bacterium]HQL80822.1 AAA family ATPase [Spirochaetota bacterium]
MSTIIAVAGKGGTGKTTTAALIIRHLVSAGKTPVLAIDADPNSNLADSLGITVRDSIGSVLSDFMRERAELPAGMTKQAYLDTKFHQILEEGKDIDMLVMGCPDGPGCYCAANSILKDYFEKLSKNYPYIVVDNEAGMEHFSRKNAARIDLLIFCSNYSLKGLKTVSSLSKMVDELKIGTDRRFLLVNRTPEVLEKEFLDGIERTGIPFLGHTVMDREIEDSEIRGVPLTRLPDESTTVRRIKEMLSNVL